MKYFYLYLLFWITSLCASENYPSMQITVNTQNTQPLTFKGIFTSQLSNVQEFNNPHSVYYHNIAYLMDKYRGLNIHETLHNPVSSQSATQITDQTFNYRNIQLDNPQSTQVLIDEEMQKYHKVYLERDDAGMQQLALKRNFLDKELNHRCDIFDVLRYFDPQRSSKIRRLSFLNRLLKQYEEQCKSTNRIQLVLKPDQQPRPFGYYNQDSAPKTASFDFSSFNLDSNSSVGNISLDQTTDMVATTHIHDNLFYQKITADPKVDFQRYMQQVEQTVIKLQQVGEWTAETAFLFTKGFVQGSAEHIKHTVQHPIEYAQNFVKANMDLLTLVTDIVPPLSDEFSMDLKQLKMYEDSLTRKTELIAQIYNNLCETVPQISREEWGRIAGRLFADCGILKGIGTSIHKGKNFAVSSLFNENPVYAKIQSSLEKALLNYPAMSTAEGIMFEGMPVLKEAEVVKESLLQAMSNDTQRTKNASGAIIRETEKIANMKELFTKNEFGKALEKCSIKIKAIDAKTNSQIYEITEKLSEYGLKEGDKIYLDKFHKDHIEVFRNDKCIIVLDLDGTVNNIKTAKALSEQRKLRLR